MKRYIFFIATLCLIIAAMFGCKDNPVKPVTAPQDTTKTDSSSKNGTKPKIISFSPEKGFDESIVVITGKNFGTDTSKFNVYFDLKKCQKLKLTWDSTNSFLTVKLPAKSKSSKFTIFRGDSSDESEKEFTFIEREVVEVLLNNAYPRSGCSGEHFYIKGRNMTMIKDELKLFMGDNPMTIENITDSLITTRFVGKGEYSIKAVYGGQTYESDNYGDPRRLYLAGRIKIISVNKLMARSGDTIAILCNYFGSEQKPKVYFGNVEAVVLSTSNAFYQYVGNNDYPELTPGSVVCIVPQNPDPSISIEGNCGTASYYYRGFINTKVISAYAEISNINCRFHRIVSTHPDTVEKAWNEIFPIASLTLFDNETKKAKLKSPNYSESPKNGSSYDLFLENTTDFSFTYDYNISTEGHTGYAAIRTSVLKFKNFKKFSEDDNQIIYELRGQEIVTNAVEVIDKYDYWSTIFRYHTTASYFLNFLEQTNDSFIRIYLQKK